MQTPLDESPKIFNQLADFTEKFIKTTELLNFISIRVDSTNKSIQSNLTAVSKTVSEQVADAVLKTRSDSVAEINNGVKTTLIEHFDNKMISEETIERAVRFSIEQAFSKIVLPYLHDSGQRSNFDLERRAMERNSMERERIPTERRKISPRPARDQEPEGARQAPSPTAPKLELDNNQLKEFIKEVGNTLGARLGDILGFDELKEEIAKSVQEYFDSFSSEREQQQLEQVKTTISERLDLSAKNVEDALKGQTQKVLEAANNSLVGIVNQAIDNRKDTGRFRWLCMSAIVVLLLMIASAAVSGYYFNAKAISSVNNAGAILKIYGDDAITFLRLNDPSKMLDCSGLKIIEQGDKTYCIPIDSQKNTSGWRIK